MCSLSFQAQVVTYVASVSCTFALFGLNSMTVNVSAGSTYVSDSSNHVCCQACLTTALIKWKLAESSVWHVTCYQDNHNFGCFEQVHNGCLSLSPRERTDIERANVRSIWQQAKAQQLCNCSQPALKHQQCLHQNSKRCAGVVSEPQCTTPADPKGGLGLAVSSTNSTQADVTAAVEPVVHTPAVLQRGTVGVDGNGMTAIIAPNTAAALAGVASLISSLTPVTQVRFAET